MELTPARTHQLIVYLPDTRGVTISPFGKGNLKIGPHVYTYSRVAGQYSPLGTCPGSTPECEDICYAKRIGGPVLSQYWENSKTDAVPALPADCRLLRIHVSGDFNTVPYILNWVERLRERPDVRCWAYTRSWRVPDLLGALEELRNLPNVQLFASMDHSTPEMPPAGWRIAWIDGDPRAGRVRNVPSHPDDYADTYRHFGNFELQLTESGTKALICPEETKSVVDCEDCGYCFDGKRNDVIFLKH